MSSRRTASTSSSVTETEATSSRARNASETSGDTTRSGSQLRERSPTNTIDGTSIAETATLRSGSQQSTNRIGTDAVSVTTAVSGNSQAQGQIPIIRAPVLQPHPVQAGPQAPTGQTPLRVNVAVAQQQQQGLSSTSSYTGSSSTGSVASSSPGRAPVNQRAPSFGNQQTKAQTQPRQQQFPNQIPRELIYNELLGPDAFKDVILDIDYGAIGSFNIPFSTGSDILGPQVPQGLNIRPAYTNVDQLNYQQHMFNTGRTVYGDAQNTNFDVGAFGDQFNTGAGQQFDVGKAIFNQVDVNHDGRISRDEFQQWAQGGAQQGYSNNYQTHQAVVNDYSNAQYTASNVGQGATVLDGSNPNIDQILQASGLNQVLKN